MSQWPDLANVADAVDHHEDPDSQGVLLATAVVLGQDQEASVDYEAGPRPRDESEGEEEICP